MTASIRIAPDPRPRHPILLALEARLHAAPERQQRPGSVKRTAFRPALNTDTFDKEERQQQEAEAEGKVDKDDDGDDGQVQQVANGVAAVVTAKRIGDSHLFDKEDGSPRPAEQQRLLPSRDLSPELDYDETRSGSDGNSNNEPSNKADSDEDNGRLRPAKRRQRSSSYDGPMPKKRSRVTAVSSPKGRLPSPAPPALQVIDAEMLSDCYNLGRSPRDVLLTLVEVTFRPHSPHYCSFTAVVQDSCDGRGVSFSQFARLVENIGHIGKIDDFLIKPLEQHSFLLNGFSCYIASRLLSSGMTVSTVVETSPIRRDATHILLQHGKAVDVEAFTLHGDEPSSSDDDSDLSPSSDNGRYSSEDELGHSRMSKHSRWSDLDEQRLLAYKKEGKSWDWIFGRFPGRTQPAIRTRWNMVRPRDK
ncbi:MAG: hypothetical protein M1840_004521 [Geoglossum simile]|nr:MAG: hypothetical protein M1840_004521 [Geoglossum simile]